MGHLDPSAGHDIKAILKKEVFGTKQFLISAETFANLKWLSTQHRDSSVQGW